MTVASTALNILEDSLYDSFKDVLTSIGYPEMEVVFSHQNGLEPTKSYCVITILERQRYGRVQESTYLAADSSEMWYTNFYKLYFQVSFIGDRSPDVAFDFDDAVGSSRVCIEAFQKRNLGYIDKSTLRRMPQPRESKWVESWNVDLNYSFALQSRQVMDWVEFIDVNGEIYRIYPEETNLNT